MSDRIGAMLEEQRSHINLIRAPLRTTKLFAICTWEGMTQVVANAARHPVVLFAVLPLLVASVIVSYFVVEEIPVVSFRQIDADGNGVITVEEATAFFPTHLASAAESLFSPEMTQDSFTMWWASSHDHPLSKPALYSGGMWRELAYIAADVVWWLALGVLSSVGLGTGMHSGLLFLFPHIYLACASADSCKNTNFWSYPVNPIYGPKDRAFQCIGGPVADGAVSIFQRFLKIAPWCIIWGSGTAIGEIPPYALSYAAARQGKKQGELEEVSSLDVVNRMKNWMLDKIQKYGFWAILALAAWPNMAFDLCGMACGQFLMPFWTFFGATLIGKAFIKVNLQAVFFVLLFSGDNIETVFQYIGSAVTNFLPFDTVRDAVGKAVQAIYATRTKIASRARGDIAEEAEQQANLVQFLMQCVVFFMVGWFAKSIVDTFAQQQQEVYDLEVIEKAVKKIGNRKEEELSDDELQSIVGELQQHATTNQANSVFLVIGLAIGATGMWLGDNGYQVCGAIAVLEGAIAAVVIDPKKERHQSFFQALGARLALFCALLVAARSA
jgi:vacuole membrane protein 1